MHERAGEGGAGKLGHRLKLELCGQPTFIRKADI